MSNEMSLARSCTARSTSASGERSALNVGPTDGHGAEA